MSLCDDVKDKDGLKRPAPPLNANDEPLQLLPDVKKARFVDETTGSTAGKAISNDVDDDFAMESELILHELVPLNEKLQRLSDKIDTGDVYEDDSDSSDYGINPFKKVKQIQRQVTALEFDIILLCLRCHRPHPQYTDIPPSTLLVECAESVFPFGHAQRLGETLLQTTRRPDFPVTSIALFIPTMIRRKRKSDSNETVDDLIAKAVAFVEPLLRYVQTSSALGHVNLNGERTKHMNVAVYYALVEHFLAAIADNPHIEHVDCSCHVPARVLLTFMAKKTASLKVLTVTMQEERLVWNGRNVHEHDFDSFADSFATAGTSKLESLTVRSNESDPRLSISILKALTIQAPVLTELKLWWNSDYIGDPPMEYWHVLAQFLQSTAMLPHLELSSFTFTVEIMMAFLAGLQYKVDRDTGLPSLLGIAKLSICDSDYEDEDTENVLLQFMRRPAASSSLQEFHLGSTRGPNPIGGSVLAGQASSPKLAEMLVMEDIVTTTTTLRATIGSHIQTVSFTRNESDCVNLLKSLSQFPKHRFGRLSTLRLNKYNIEQCMGVVPWLSRVPSIRHLHLAAVVRHKKFSSWLLKMLGANGSLFSVTTDEPRLLSPAQWRHANAFGERNKFMAQHFSGQSAACKDGSELVDETGVETASIDPMRYPSLFEAAKDVPLYKSKCVTSGLQGLGDSIGYD